MAKQNRSQPVAGATRDAITLRPLRRDDWPNLEELFGSNGACGGCWCMWWRVPRGGKLWVESKGAKNRAAFRKLVDDGAVRGILAFSGTQPVGWCSFGPRSTFPRLERVKALKRSWSEQTWSINCFFVPRAWRGGGIARRLVKEATKAAFDSGASEVEGYPVVPATSGAAFPAVFAWTGVPALFESNGYRELPQQEGHRRVYLITSSRADGKTRRLRKKSSAARPRRIVE